MVAKTYQNYEILTEPYEKNKRFYVKARNPKTNAEKEIRWYSVAEYRKMYPAEVLVLPSVKSQKEVLGFQEGYITLIEGKGVEALPQSRYATLWGWYIPSTDEVPTGFTTKKLFWTEVGNEKGEIIKK